MSAIFSLSSFSQDGKDKQCLQPIASCIEIETVSKSQIRVFADMIGSFDYLTDKDGYNYGAVFYLYNPNDYTVSVSWLFVGSVNVRFGPANSDRTTFPAKTKLWITTCNVVDKSKKWDSGMLKWKY